MRVICNVGKSVKVEELQRRTKWLSVSQAVAYHSLMVARRILTTEQPKYLFVKLSKAIQNERRHNYGTRHGTIQAAAPRLALISALWLYRVVEMYRRLPRDMVALPVGGNRDKLYKNRLRTWVIMNY